MEKVIVLFEVTPKKTEFKRYLEIAQHLLPTLMNNEGLISSERFSSLSVEGKFLSMSIWRNEESITKWRTEANHRQGQFQGFNTIFESYTITVVKPVREYTMTDRMEAPIDSNKFLEKSIIRHKE